MVDRLAARLAERVLSTGQVDGGPLAPAVTQALKQDGDRWGRWSLQLFIVALPLEEAVDSEAVVDPRMTHVGVGLAQSPTVEEVRTAVVQLVASER